MKVEIFKSNDKYALIDIENNKLIGMMNVPSGILIKSIEPAFKISLTNGEYFYLQEGEEIEGADGPD